MNFPKTLIKVLFPMVFFVGFCSAQTKELDSLKAVLETADDTTKVNTLRLIGSRYRRINKEEALKFGIQSLEEARKVGFIQGETRALFSLGLTHGMTDSYPESLDYLKQCLALSLKHKDFERVNYVYNSLGIVYRRIGDYPKSQEYYLKSIELVDSLGYGDAISTRVNLANLFTLMGQTDEAVETYESILAMDSLPEPLKNRRTILNGLAVIDYDNQSYETALEKFLQVREIVEKMDNQIGLTLSSSNIGRCYMNLGQWEMAERYFLESLEIAQQLSLEKRIVIAYQNLANLRLSQKRYQEAIAYSKKNLAALEKLLGSYEEHKDAHEVAYKIYQGAGRLKESILHLNLVMDYKDSLLNETKVKEIQNLQVRHEVYLKDREIKENELELALLNTQVSLNNKRMVYLSIIAFLLLFSAGLLYFRFRAKKRANAQLKSKNDLISQQKQVIEDMNLRMEKQMLRAQMNPHFIFNSLNSIQHLINTDNRVSALKYLTKFSKLLRQVLESSINVNLVLQEEIELLKIYLELESLRFDNSFSYTINIDDNLDVEEHEVPMLLVQPYIENAIIHGLMPKDGPKNLSISFNNKKDFIECTIEDDGVGIPPKPRKEKVTQPSRGMSITAQRIAALEKFSDRELLTIESLKDGTKNGTRVTILIPKHKLDEKELSKQAV